MTTPGPVPVAVKQLLYVQSQLGRAKLDCIKELRQGLIPAGYRAATWRLNTPEGKSL